MAKTWGEYAKDHGLTIEQLQAERMSYLQCEGYDDAGNEYATLDAWLARKPIKESYEPYGGGRGAGDYGHG